MNKSERPQLYQFHPNTLDIKYDFKLLSKVTAKGTEVSCATVLKLRRWSLHLLVFMHLRLYGQ